MFVIQLILGISGLSATREFTVTEKTDTTANSPSDI